MRKAKSVVVIGAGIGGLTTAALLAQAGHQVSVLEANTFPGGCAATFVHKGYRFDAGATVAGGFHANGPHTVIGEKLGIQWPVYPAETAWVVHLPDRRIAVRQDKAAILQQFPHSAAFWEEQEQIADIGWSLAAQGLPWPPTNRAEWMRMAGIVLANFRDGIRVLPYVFRTAYDWLDRHGLAQDRAFVRFMDGQLLISAQTTTRFANAIYSATALDLPRQGVAHVRGGIGQLAQNLADKVRALGGEVLYRQRVTGFQMDGGRVIGVQYKLGRHASETATLPCDFVVANLTPATLNTLLGAISPSRLQREVQQREAGWDAFVLHVGVDKNKLPSNFADHHQIITDWDLPLGEGRSIFVSLSPGWDETRAPAGKRAVTVTTHTAVKAWWDLLHADPATYNDRKKHYTDRILNAIDRFLPGFRQSTSLILPGSPVTYHYFTGRDRGAVGGFPQTSLLETQTINRSEQR